MSRRHLLFLVLVVAFGVLIHLNIGLAMGIFVLAFPSFLTLVLIKKRGGENKKALLFLFTVVLLVHLAAVLFVHYAEFYPFGTGTKQGDQGLYHLSSSAIAEEFRRGNFSPASVKEHITEFSLIQSYPAVVGSLYALTVSDQFVGKAFNVWLIILSVFLVFWIALEIGATRTGAVIAGLAAALYPSYLYFGTLLIREALMATLVLASLLFMLKVLQRFSWRHVGFFALLAFLAIHYRFYVGIILLAVFAGSFLLFSKLDWPKRLRYGAVIIPLLGFLPMLLGHGYYGVAAVSFHLAPERVELYREHVYAVPVDRADTRVLLPILKDPGQEILPPQTEEEKRKTPGSTVVVKAGTESPYAFVRNYLISFFYVSVGPLPIHLYYARHLFTLLETIPLYILLFLIARGVFAARARWRIITPVLLSALGMLAAIGLLIGNFGIYMRLRMPAFLMLSSLVALYPFRFRILQFVDNMVEAHWRLIKKWV